MGKIILTKVFVQGRTFDSYIYKFLDCLENPCPSMPAMLKLSMLVRWPVVVWWPYMGEGAFRHSLYLAPNLLVDSPVYSLSQPTLLHLYQYMIHFCNVGGLYPLVLQVCS